MKTYFTFAFILFTVTRLVSTICPPSAKSLQRIGQTRYYIIQNLTHRGDFVTLENARSKCKDMGLKLATVKNMLALAVVGRELEKIAFDNKLKDTWYWLDAKYNAKDEQYIWGDGEKLKFNLFVYRSPRPIGVSSHITFKGKYVKLADIPQCLTLALPWDHSGKGNVYNGHQTAFDERNCKSESKRHAICEAEKDCNPPPATAALAPFTLDEEKTDYFESGNWIFGDRKYILNWKQVSNTESATHCKKLGLQMMTAGKQENLLIPHIKMWSRSITASQFWTSISYNQESDQFRDTHGTVIANHPLFHNFTEHHSSLRGRSNKLDSDLCVALSLVYEFKEQMPCPKDSAAGCEWSFIQYAPANCKNYHGSICQHDDYKNRNINWPPEIFTKDDLTEMLKSTSLTSEFGYSGHYKVLRSKYKQTFGNCYCPKGYIMLQSKGSNFYPSWAVKVNKTEGRVIYDYDYLETYWIVDETMFNKTADSLCTISMPTEGSWHRKNKQVKCTEWHFYLCKKISMRPSGKFKKKFNPANPMKWNSDVQPRVYPLYK